MTCFGIILVFFPYTNGLENPKASIVMPIRLDFQKTQY